MQFIIYFTNEFKAPCRFIMQAESKKEVKLSMRHLKLVMNDAYIINNGKQVFLQKGAK